jgi:hypothetical protein
VEWQLVCVSLLIAAAAGYLGRQTWRTWRAKQSGCGGGCHCHTQTNDSDNGSVTLIPVDQLTSRLPARNPRKQQEKIKNN